MPSQSTRSRVRVVLSLLFFLVTCYTLVQLYSVFTLYQTATRPFASVTPIPSRRGDICDETVAPTRNIAIIGAGSAGASTAYHLRQWASPCTPVNITVLERSHYVGGRSTTINVHGDPLEPVELGASIFVAVNHVLVDTAAALGLATRNSSPSPPPEIADAEMGIWDGTSFRFVMARDEPRWKLAARLLWRYGTAPVRVQGLMRETIHRFLELYDAPQFPFASLSRAAEEVNLLSATGKTGDRFLDENSVAAAYGLDIVQASTRVNYAQNLDQIHGLETMVCMAAEGEPMAIAGGNWRLFASMIAASDASLRLETEVASVRKKETGSGFLVRTNTSRTEHEFDAVVLAAPWAASKVSFEPAVRNPPAKVEYVPLHVTLFTSPYRLRPSYFGLATDQAAPATILTTTSDEAPKDGASSSARSKRIPFLSISLLRSVRNPQTSGIEYAYKIFSRHELSEAFLHELLDVPESKSKSQSRPVVTWMHRKLWHAYPFLKPRMEFDGPEMHMGDKSDGKTNAENRAPLYYTGGMEPFISTMETSALMGRNVAALMVRWMGEEQANQQQSTNRPGLQVQGGQGREPGWQEGRKTEL